jgi:hypothetical protein
LVPKVQDESELQAFLSIAAGKINSKNNFEKQFEAFFSKI